MTSRTRSSSSSRKGQFFVLATFAIVTTMFFVSKWVEPFRVIDTSDTVLNEEIFLFNNIRQQTEKVISESRTCQDLKFNMQEFNNTVSNFVAKKSMKFIFTCMPPTTGCTCSDSGTSTISVYLALLSPSAGVDDSFIYNRPASS